MQALTHEQTCTTSEARSNWETQSVCQEKCLPFSRSARLFQHSYKTTLTLILLSRFSTTTTITTTTTTTAAAAAVAAATAAAAVAAAAATTTTATTTTTTAAAAAAAAAAAPTTTTATTITTTMITLKDANRDFYNLLTAPPTVSNRLKWPGRNGAQITWNTLSAWYVQPAACQEGTPQQLSYAELKSCSL